MALEKVLYLKGGPRFEGRHRGDSQPMKCAERQTEDSMEDAQTPCSHSVRKFSIGTIELKNVSSEFGRISRPLWKNQRFSLAGRCAD
jgi:hypothetical protein